jgi:hypothetical protein
MRTASSSNKGESHRIYWQQWLGPSVNTNGTAALPDNGGVKSRRDLITSSAAVRISPTGARAMDVTQLLRKTLNISSLSSLNSNAANGNGNGNANPNSQEQDCLVLVGTLYSLPRDYVQFEHEQQQQQQQQDRQRFTHSQYAQPQQSQQPPPQQSQPHSHSDPFHVVRTLRPHDNPVFVRNRMAAHLQKLLDEAASGVVNTTRTIISPKLQWYFVPAATETASPIPNCIDLDGYCTSMEDDNDDEEEDDNDAHDGLDYQDEDDELDDEKDENDCQTPKDESQSLLLSRFPWLQAVVDTSSVATAATQLPADTDERHRLAQQQQQRLRRVSKEERRYQELSSSQSSLRHYCMSGYLLKRSRRDPHVWRRVHCVLTDDYLWYVSRVYAYTDGSNSSDSNHGNSNHESPRVAKYQTPPMAKHGRIRLTRALLLEPAPEYAPLYRTPNAFEVVSAKGTSHVFRAASKSLQLKWIQTLSERIVQSYENSLLENAELIVADECLARNRRRTSTAVQPLWDAVCASQDPSSVHTLRLGAILRLGIEVAEYRECCRHVQARMPAKNPVVVTTPRRASPTRSGDVQRTPPNAFVASEPMDPVLQDMIRTAWEHTAALLARVTHVALQVQSGPTDHKKPSRSIETQCRHIDYVITGRFRSSRSLNGSELATTDSIDTVSRRLPNGSSGGGGGSSSSSNNMSSTVGANSHEPPPTDLFDSLLSELQGLVASTAQHPVRATGSENGTTNGENHHPDYLY